ncbi:hypothetical protein FJQ54_08540 [Sandaracinobacter neustonicus]|uniref:Mth938-like domain-containing protein n=2 Tax=Sandaracinobacter neustonicus TaxID=1715348 RepID=A0A501XM77_9SPHN|nr:hypothetical protein FJQ54_08540 [Sandaracinobacter neustonicus]
MRPSPSRIEGRTADGWVVAGRLYRPALLLTQAFAGTLPRLDFAALESVQLPELEGVELLLLGTGDTLRRPPMAFTEALRPRGWRVEPMDSASAARTFNVLAAEERLVGALIL